MLKNFYIIRHGESSYNICGRIQGRNDNSFLTENGKTQAIKAGQILTDKKIEIIISSPLKRAYETGQIIAELLNIPIKKDQRFIEVKLGQAEGLYYDEIEKKFGNLCRLWRQSSNTDNDIRFPGGESKKEVRFRIFDGLNYYANQTSYHNLGISSHGIMLTQILQFFRTNQTDIPNCSILHIQNINHNWQCKGFL